MTTAEELRNRIVQRWQAGASARVIARELGVSRSTVRNVLAEFQAGRSGDEQLPRPARPSKLARLAADDQQLVGAISGDHRSASL